jgi:hypothetical protein
MYENDLSEVFEDTTTEGILSRVSELLSAAQELLAGKRAQGIIEDCIFALRHDSRLIGIAL